MVARWQASQSSAGPGNRWLGNHRRGGLAVRRFAPGDIVYSYSFANPKGGFYAEYVAVAAEKVGRPPGALSLREAGAAPPTGVSAIPGIYDVRAAKRGEGVVVHTAFGCGGRP